jgi:hypothetical protein
MFWNTSSDPEPVDSQTFTFIEGHAPPEIEQFLKSQASPKIEELPSEAKSKRISATIVTAIADDMAQYKAELKEAVYKKYAEKYLHKKAEQNR